ncbi:hypothetical protein EV702DRAFT_1194008 [Suillus placidus]|uniref:F-box domain-containing protein n=1 Tax=Suillus placidus TaxID=48579 RepID=A0A9P7A118_9AGAM|nr:hypothetical protein EV702DRAFT_1194008 [Suillus placidus]
MQKSGDKLSLVKTSRQYPIAPLLPAEILSLILIRSPAQWTPDAWRENVNVLLSCCHVSKAWGETAREGLYLCIRLSQVESLRLLLRTVHSESFGGHCPARALHFKPWFSTPPMPHNKQLKKFTTLAGEIVSCCPKLIHLAGDCGPLRFTSTMALPKYPFLTGLKVSGQDLQLLAPLLFYLCNLESFEMHQSYGDGDVLGLCFSPPTFKLSNILISQTYLSLSLCKWLFSSSSESIESLEVQDVGASLCHLIEVIGDFVKKLHIKHIYSEILTDSEAIEALSGLAGLRSLRIDGSWGFKTEPLLNLQSSLETFAFSSCVAHEVQTRLQSGWQPSLQSLDMYYGPFFSLVSWRSFIDKMRESYEMSGRCELAMTCAARGVQLNEIDLGVRPKTLVI